MSTIREQVYDYLRAISPSTATNTDIAHELAIPEPSVRRATAQLEKALRIHVAMEIDPGSYGRLYWRT